ncbi:MAG: hypothetical protein K0R54_4293 [Clostridiaceae bacterium]|jgi:predicted RNase H-like HicB family nuclease|nr:hypothetical protein [Clostridiaceae bacterium]
MYKDLYIFPALFESEEQGYCVTFPDLPGCITQGDNLEEAYAMAKEALELHLYGMEEDGDNISKPTKPNKIKVDENSFVSLIEAWMPLVRREMKNQTP